MYGYVCGGYNSSKVRRINFSNVGNTLLNENINLHEIKHDATALDGTIF